MGKKTKIDWADSTWNPVTGCYHGCAYCYAKRIAERFGGCDQQSTYGIRSRERFLNVHPWAGKDSAIFEVSKNHPPINRRFDPEKQKEIISIAPYPFGFRPTFRRDRLDLPKQWTKPRTIFVCSMADLFGDWIPAEWIWEVFNACREAPQHRYLFLTKNPMRYNRLLTAGLLPEDDNFWFGSSYETDRWNTQIGQRVVEPEYGAVNSMTEDFAHLNYQYTWHTVPGGTYAHKIGNRHRFISFEPLLTDIMHYDYMGTTEWYIIGAETGSREGKIVPEREWVRHIVKNADRNGAKVFMKESIRELMGNEFRQEFPWE